MHQIDTPSAVAEAPGQITAMRIPGFWISSISAGGAAQQATAGDQDYANAQMMEPINVLRWAGLTDTKGQWTQVRDAIAAKLAAQFGAAVYFATDTSGAANQITAANISPAPANQAALAGKLVLIEVANTTTLSAVNIDLGGFGNVPLAYPQGASLPAPGLVAAGSVIGAVYDPAPVNGNGGAPIYGLVGIFAAPPTTPRSFVYGGNPNGKLAGHAGNATGLPADRCFDIANGTWYTCTATGNAAAAVWTQEGLIRCTATLVLYVDPRTGNDANDGLTAGTACATLNGAFSAVRTRYQLATQTLQVKLAYGTDIAPVTHIAGMVQSGPIAGAAGGFAVQILGNPADPGSCLLSAGASDAIACYEGFDCYVDGVTLSGRTAINAERGSNVYFANCALGACTVAQLYAADANIYPVTAHSLVGSAPCHAAILTGKIGWAYDGNPCAVTVGAGLTFANGFLNGNDSAKFSMPDNLTFSSTAVTGPTATLAMLSLLDTNNRQASLNAGVFLPGSTAGTATGGSQFN
jgi:hypothetical protein